MLGAWHASAQADRFTVYVEGLTCPMCAKGLEGKFGRLKGVADVKVDYKTGKLTFSMPPKRQLQFSEVNALVEKAGYTPKGAIVYRASGQTEKWGELKAIAPPGRFSSGSR